jgi:hypothetical protein
MMAVKDLRREVLAECDTLEVLLIFTHQVSMRQGIISIRESINTSTARRLRNLRDDLHRNIKDLVSRSGCKVKPNALRKLIEGCPDFGYVPKWIIDNYFTNLRSFSPNWKSMPAHALIGLDVKGGYSKIGEFQFILPEGALYEDMCFAYNLAAETCVDLDIRGAKVMAKKTHSFFLRTALLASFYFIESYLNGLAFDFVFRLGKERCKKLTDQDQDLLSEWDSRKNRQKWVSFRDKMTQYPKIILGLEAPPLTESNCEEMRILTGEAKEFRDSLVHASPNPFAEVKELDEVKSLVAPKVKAMFALRLNVVTKIVDSAVGFVRKLNDRLGELGQNIGWLHGRAESGLFPDEAFK